MILEAETAYYILPLSKHDLKPFLKIKNFLLGAVARGKSLGRDLVLGGLLLAEILHVVTIFNYIPCDREFQLIKLLINRLK